MKPGKKIPALRQRLLKVAACVLMSFCLLFLTGVNFIVFPQNNITAAQSSKSGNEEKDPSAPVEEKSSTGNGLSIQEEYIHELHSLDEFAAIIKISRHMHPPVEKLQKVHFELISPPPEA